MKRPVVAALSIAALTPALVAVGRPQSHPASALYEWDYSPKHGPSHWGKLKPEFAACRAGGTSRRSLWRHLPAQREHEGAGDAIDARARG